METTETKFQRRFRLTAGVLMALQTIAFFNFAGFIFIMVLFLGGLASIGGGAGVSDEQFIKTWWMIGFTAIYPGLVAILLTIATFQIFRRKGRVFIVFSCLLFIFSCLGVAYLLRDEGTNTMTLVAGLPLLVPLIAIVSAFQMRSKRG